MNKNTWKFLEFASKNDLRNMPNVGNSLKDNYLYANGNIKCNIYLWTSPKILRNS